MSDDNFYKTGLAPTQVRDMNLSQDKTVLIECQ